MPEQPNETDVYLARKLFRFTVPEVSPRFTSTLMLAWQVEEAMHEAGWESRIQHTRSGWIAEFTKEGVQGDWSGWTGAETICGAARAALEADEDEHAPSCDVHDATDAESAKYVTCTCKVVRNG